MNKIESLTDEQERQLITFRQEYLEIGLATGKANIEAIRPTINDFYNRIDEDEPYLWRVKSPIMANLVINVLLQANLGDNLGANLWDNLWANLRANLGDNLWANLRANLGDNDIKYFYTDLWGSLDSYWIVHYTFPHQHIKHMHTDEQMHLLNGWLNIAKNAFWWYPFANICFVCDRPTVIHKDENGRLHNAKGPAISFSDGWNIYCWHGTNIPENFITEPMTIERVNEQDNLERKRIAIEIMGYENYLSQSGAALIQYDDFGRLFTFPSDDNRLLVEVINGTPNPDGSDKIYVIPIPRWNEITQQNMQSAHEAVAWSYNLRPEQYQIINRT